MLVDKMCIKALLLKVVERRDCVLKVNFICTAGHLPRLFYLLTFLHAKGPNELDKIDFIDPKLLGLLLDKMAFIDTELFSPILEKN